MSAVMLGQLVGALIMMGVLLYPFCRIFGKAGFSGWLGILMIVPFVNLIALYYLALAEWPIHRGGGR